MIWCIAKSTAGFSLLLIGPFCALVVSILFSVPGNLSRYGSQPLPDEHALVQKALTINHRSSEAELAAEGTPTSDVAIPKLTLEEELEEEAEELIKLSPVESKPKASEKQMSKQVDTRSYQEMDLGKERIHQMTELYHQFSSDPKSQALMVTALTGHVEIPDSVETGMQNLASEQIARREIYLKNYWANCTDFDSCVAAKEKLKDHLKADKRERQEYMKKHMKELRKTIDPLNLVGHASEREIDMSLEDDGNPSPSSHPDTVQTASSEVRKVTHKKKKKKKNHHLGSRNGAGSVSLSSRWLLLLLPVALTSQ
eukprot:gnl/TRDRNA2_/TRDRNA2_189798_c0_seq1.p1 gnl/TRDRNA2_/TRDRNA2_189798_c0~~gnl/TRDRNA2_/TRDRNA2_189798_c0_seq1.p1  ORF type:complete len:312 (+),score=75.02 gnl/TRDRNA2_/TRDRNA2_189798_c0_seq1:94-1029(+)